MSPGCSDGGRKGGGGGAVTLGWVIPDVHVKALTRGMWPACTLDWSSEAAQHRGQVVMQSQRVLLICSHCVLVCCHTKMPPVASAPLPHPSAEMTLVGEGRIHLQCVLYNISLTMQSWIRDICDESFIKTFSPHLSFPCAQASLGPGSPHAHVSVRMSSQQGVSGGGEEGRGVRGAGGVRVTQNRQSGALKFILQSQWLPR